MNEAKVLSINRFNPSLFFLKDFIKLRLIDRYSSEFMIDVSINQYSKNCGGNKRTLRITNSF